MLAIPALALTLLLTTGNPETSPAEATDHLAPADTLAQTSTQLPPLTAEPAVREAPWPYAVYVLSGLVVGGGAGTGIGYLLGSTGWPGGPESALPNLRPIALTAFGGLLGGLLGIAVGWQLHSVHQDEYEEWRHTRTATLLLVPGGEEGGWQLGLVARF